MIDVGRDKRQNEIVDKWYAEKRIGLLIAATGFGKTRVAMIAIKRLLEERGDARTMVIVPTLTLQEQWKRLIKGNRFTGVEVVVINTACKNVYDVDLLILDECHRVPAPEFQQVLSGTRYKYLLGLTATIERADGEEKILTDIASVIDEITIAECLSNGWVSGHTIYNLRVPFLDSEKGQYEKYEKGFKYSAARCGFGGSQSFKQAQMWLKTGTKEQKGIAAMYYNCMRKRGDIAKNAFNKIAVATEIVNKFPDRYTLLFAESTDFSEGIQESLGDICVTFHSKMTKKQQKEALKAFNDGRTKKRVISSVKALNEGLDVPNISLGIVCAGNSRKLDSVQRLGRVIRAEAGKQAIFVNLYVQDTQEQVWLKKRTEGQDVKWITSIDEII